jgi:ABC-type glycerol-3-phosphate transport system substrate-binding protein
VQIYGTALKAQSPAWSVKSYASFFMPMGGHLMSDDYKGASESLKSQLSVDVLSTMKALGVEGLIPEPLTWTYDDVVMAFQGGTLAMAFEYSALAKKLEDPKSSKVVGKMGAHVFAPGKIGPHTPSVPFATWRFGIDKNSKVKDAAFAFIDYMTSVETQRYLAFEWGNGPTLLRLYDDPEYMKVNSAAQAIKKALQVGPGDVAPVPEGPKIIAAVHEELQSFILGRQDERQTGRSFYDRIQKIMGK